MRKWYTDIILDKGDWPILLEAIEAQIDLSEGLYIKLNQEMKKVLISYVNDVTDLTTVLDFHNVILKLKSPIMDKLSFTHNVTHINVVNTIYDEIIEDKEFSDEMIIMYNNILSNKLDNDDIDNNNNNNVNTNNLVSNKRKSLKRKYNDDANNKNNDLNTKTLYPIVRKSKKKYQHPNIFKL